MNFAKRVEDGKTKVIQDDEVSKYPESNVQYGMRAYWAKTNLRSLDGLPGILTAHKVDFEPKSVYSVEECAGVDAKSESQLEGGGKGKVVVGGSQLEKQNLKLVAAFALGMLLTATYVRLTKHL